MPQDFHVTESNIYFKGHFCNCCDFPFTGQLDSLPALCEGIIKPGYGNAIIVAKFILTEWFLYYYIMSTCLHSIKMVTMVPFWTWISE